MKISSVNKSVKPGKTTSPPDGTAYFPWADLGACLQPLMPLAAPSSGVRTGWWIKTSPEQLAGARGQPAGFRHGLMFGNRLVKSGTGADEGRTFRAQVDFLNARGLQPVWN
jgi:hypothetical protein